MPMELRCRLSKCPWTNGEPAVARLPSAFFGNRLCSSPPSVLRPSAVSSVLRPPSIFFGLRPFAFASAFVSSLFFAGSPFAAFNLPCLLCIVQILIFIAQEGNTSYESKHQTSVKQAVKCAFYWSPHLKIFLAPSLGRLLLDSEMEDRGTMNKSSGKKEKSKDRGLDIEGYKIEGLSIAGHETCIIVPSLNLAFDIGKCPQRAISQQFLFISHGHMDHIGGLPMYVATRGLYRMAPPTIIVPKVIKENVEKIFEAHRAMDQSELKHTLIGLDVGEEFYLRKDLKVKAFRTYHVIPSQGYLIYSVKQKLKQEYVGLPGDEIKKLKLSGVEITYTMTAPEIAFTGDTMSDFIVDTDNVDVLRAKILIMESTYVENSMKVEDARDYGHTHLSEIVKYAERFQNKAILLIHFSARYKLDVIQEAISAVPPPLAGRIYALTEGF